MAENRLARDLESRVASQRPTTWAPPQTLPTPTPAEGWSFRWIRIGLMGRDDPTNVSSKLREGWEPVKAADHPELMLDASPNVNPRFKDNVEIGGLVLCKIPSEVLKQRRDYYDKLTNSQMDAVDNSFLRQKDARTNMDLFKESKRTEVSFGRGSK